MNLTIGLRFPWGRLHATPWERSANEAQIEWPPSPWRLLRALYSVWRFRCPELDDAVVARVLGALAPPPDFHLPRSSEGHTRHYFPDKDHRQGANGSTDKVFDAFIVIPVDDPVMMRWNDLVLDPEAGQALDRMLEMLPFLGRAESLCDASVLADATGAGWDQPLGPGERLDGLREVRVLVPETPLDLPRLLATTAEVRRKGFADPPGSRRVRYGLPAPPPVVSKPRRPAMPKPTIAVLGAHANVLPHVKVSVAMGELLRMSLQSKFEGAKKDASSATFSGKTDGGKPRIDQHRHAHYLPLPRLVDDVAPGHFIDRFVIWAPEGLDEKEVRAVTALRELDPGHRAKVDGGRGLRRVDVRLEALGGSALLAEELTGPARHWESLTPFTTKRHVNGVTRRRLADADDPWSEFLVEEVKRELRLRDHGAVEVTMHEHRCGLSWREYRRHRAFNGDTMRSAHQGAFARLRFDQPVTGPLALGALSHFGLGLFVPDRSAP